MSWFADLAGKAENLLNNIDEQTGAALRNHNVVKQKKHDKNDIISYEAPNWPAKSQKRLHRSPTRRPLVNSSDMRMNSPPRRLAPPSRIINNGTRAVECLKEVPSRLRKSPTRKNNNFHYDLNNCPRTLVGDDIIREENEIILDQFGLKERRFSLPDNLGNVYTYEQYSCKLQNIEVENAMLKNELNVMNKEVSDLLDKLRATEDDLSKARKKIDCVDKLNTNLNEENNSLTKQVQQLKQKIDDLINIDIIKFKETNKNLQNDLDKLKETKEELEEKVKKLESQNVNTSTKLESDLRHTQSYVSELQNDLEKSKSECHRLEKDWEAYKLRVKSMLHAKDKEIKTYQEGGVIVTEDTKILTDELERLREEKEELTEAVARVGVEFADMKQYVEELESRSESAERLVSALRDALREERLAKNKADSDCIMIKREFKKMQQETTQTITSLNNVLREKEAELSSIKEMSSSSMSNSDSSALNVADYDVLHESIANEKIQFLTQTLVSRQEKVDSLLSENNMLRIQLEKLSLKCKELVTHQNNHHSVVNVNDTDSFRLKRRSTYIPESVLSRVSLRFAMFLKRNPAFRILVFTYMIGLHFWVALVLLTYTPEAHSVTYKS